MYPSSIMHGLLMEAFELNNEKALATVPGK